MDAKKRENRHLEFEKICMSGDEKVIIEELKNIGLKDASESHYVHIDMYEYCLSYGLFGACKGGHLHIAKLMIDKGADGWKAALKFACKGGNIEIVKLLIQKGIDERKDVCDHDHKTITQKELNEGLENACEGGHFEIAKFMIERKATDFDQGLYGACKAGNHKIMTLMIENGANDWNLALKGACENGSLDVINYIIERGANNWNYGLYGACIGGHLDIIDMAIKNGARNWALGLEGACEGGHLEIVKTMIEKGTGYWYETDFSRGFNIARQFGHLRIVNHMIDNHLIDHFWDSVLSCSSLFADSDTVKLMIKNNVSLKSHKYFFSYPKNKEKVFMLYELGLPIEMFKDIEGYDKFLEDVRAKKTS